MTDYDRKDDRRVLRDELVAAEAARASSLLYYEVVREALTQLWEGGGKSGLQRTRMGTRRIGYS